MGWSLNGEIDGTAAARHLRRRVRLKPVSLKVGWKSWD